MWLKLHGSAPRRFGMDTGSTGIVVAAEHYTPAPGDVAGGAGRLVYSSSGRIPNGERYTTTVEILRNGEVPAATARVQVLRVTSITCLERARDRRPEQNRAASPSWAWASPATRPEHRGRCAENPFTNIVALPSGAPASRSGRAT